MGGLSTVPRCFSSWSLTSNGADSTSHSRHCLLGRQEALLTCTGASPPPAGAERGAHCSHRQARALGSGLPPAEAVHWGSGESPSASRKAPYGVGLLTSDTDFSLGSVLLSLPKEKAVVNLMKTGKEWAGKSSPFQKKQPNSHANCPSKSLQASLYRRAGRLWKCSSLDMLNLVIQILSCHQNSTPCCLVYPRECVARLLPP